MNKEILHRAIALLSRREHSATELSNKLCQRGYEYDEVNPVILSLIEQDYISDERYADCVLRSRVNKGYGWRFVQNELSQKGVSSSIAQKVVKNHQIDWYLQAELAYNKRFGNSQIEDQKDKAKRIRFLQYRGFSNDEIMAAIYSS